MKFVFFGTDDFSSAILEKLISDFYYPVLVVTMPDRPVGRKQVLTSPVVKHVCDHHGIEVVQPEQLEAIHDRLKTIGADFFIVASYGKIISKETLDLALKGAVNVHTSLLPGLRGPSPIQQAILDGLDETGISLIQMDEKMDHGPVYLMKSAEILPTETYRTLHAKLAHVGADTLAKALPDIASGKLVPKEQNHDQATFTKIIKKEDARIDWNKPAVEIERMVRAYYDWPIAWTVLPDGKRMKILQSKLAETDLPLKPAGTIVFANKYLFIACQNSYLELLSVQVEGGKVMKPEQFIVGFQRFEGERVGTV